MAHSYNYSVLQIIPDARRGERVNVGLVIFRPGTPDVRISPSLQKVAALNETVDLGEIRQLPDQLIEWVGNVSGADAQHAALSDLGYISVSGMGALRVNSDADYEHVVSRLMKTLVEPVTAKTPRREGNRRITTELKARFREKDVLGKSQRDIERHKVVPDYPIEPREGLYADFALRNGVLTIIATADLRPVSATVRDKMGIAGFAAVKVDKAKSSLGKNTRRTIVFASRPDDDVRVQQNLMTDYADDIYDLSSRRDMANFMRQIMSAASHTKSIEE